MLKLSVPAITLVLALGCSTGGGDAVAPEQPAGAPDAVAEEPDVMLTAPEEGAETETQTAANLDLAPLECDPLTTTYQIGRNENGVEQWCDRNGVMHGPYKRWHLNGKKAVQGSYVDNQPAGAWRWWHSNGEKESRGTYAPNGKQIGNWTWWHDNGERAQEGDFDSAGRKSGLWHTWHDNGIKAEEGFYVNGQRQGTWIFYTVEGERERVQIFVHGVPQGEEDEEEGRGQ